MIGIRESFRVLRERGLIAVSSRLLQSKELRHAGLLIGATAAAQVVVFGTAPILARLFTPEQFGFYSVLLSTASICAPLSAACYYVVIYIAKTVAEAAAAFWLSLLIVPFGAAVCTAIYLLFKVFLLSSPSELLPQGFLI